MWRLLALCLLVPLALAAARPASYLVVPFYNSSGNPNLDWIGESVAETIRDALATFDVAVVSREQRQAAAHRLSLRSAGLLTKASIIKLARECGAGEVIYGRFEFRSAGEESGRPRGALKLVAHSIRLDRFAPGPEWKTGGDIATLSQLQTRLSWMVLRYAAPQAAPTEQQYFEDRPPVRIDAMENFVRGLLAAGLEEKHRYFTRAVDLEPEFSQACFHLGKMQWEDASYRVAAKWLERVKPSDAHYPEANFLLGLSRYYTGEYAGAQAAFDLVARSAPTVEVYNNLGLAQFRLGMPAAIESLKWALGRRPTDPDLHFNTGYVLWRQGDLDGAAAQFLAVLKLDPEDAEARRMLARCRLGRGPRRGDLSTEGLERLEEVFPPRQGVPVDAPSR